LVAFIALIAGLVGGAMGAVVIGLIQAWTARAKGIPVHRWEAISHSPRVPGMATPSVGTGPFDRFTDRGKLVLALAQDEAIRHNHNYIGTEHLLSALLRDTDSIAARALSSLGIELTKVRTALEFIIGRGNQPTSPSEITLSPRTKKVIELSIDEARKLGHSHIGPEHVLLGLAREGEGVASGILESLGVSMAAARAKVLELLKESGS
jgi:ATP-dependent Clp protease ATP-binding subunit ClpC